MIIINNNDIRRPSLQGFEECHFFLLALMPPLVENLNLHLKYLFQLT